VREKKEKRKLLREWKVGSEREKGHTRRSGKPEKRCCREERELEAGGNEGGGGGQEGSISGGGVRRNAGRYKGRGEKQMGGG